MWNKYRTKKKVEVLYLTLNFNFYLIATILSFVGVLLDYLKIQPEIGHYKEFLVSLGGVALLLSSFFLFAFIQDIFLEDQSRLLFISRFFVGLMSGLFLGNISFIETVVRTRLSAITYLFCTIINLYFTILSLKEIYRTKEKEIILGYLFLSLYSFFTLIIFALFVITVISGDHYGITYILGWTLGLISSFCGYIGIFRPKSIYKFLI